MKVFPFIVFIFIFIIELESTPVNKKNSGISNDSWIIYQVTEPVEHADGPIWDGRNNIFYYVDIQSERVLGYNYNTKKTHTISLSENLLPHFPSLWSANLLFVGSDQSRVAEELNGDQQIINEHKFINTMVGLSAFSASASATATATAGPGMTATATASATSTVTPTSNPVPTDTKVVTGGPIADATAVAINVPYATTTATATATALKNDVKNGNFNLWTRTLGSENGTTEGLTSDREILNMASNCKVSNAFSSMCDIVQLEVEHQEYFLGVGFCNGKVTNIRPNCADNPKID